MGRSALFEEEPRKRCKVECCVAPAMASENKINVRVVATGPDGDVGLRFNMTLDTHFGRMMNVWCSHNDVPNYLVLFMHRGQQLRPGDTPSSHGWIPQCGPMIIRAEPRDSAPSANSPADGSVVQPSAYSQFFEEKAALALKKTPSQPAGNTQVVLVMKKKTKKKMLEEMGATHPLRLTWYNKRGHRCAKGMGQPSIPYSPLQGTVLSSSPLQPSVNCILFQLARRLDSRSGSSPARPFHAWWDRPFDDKSAGRIRRIWWYKPNNQPEWRWRLGTSHPAAAC